MFEDFILRRGRETQLETRFLLNSYLYLHVTEIKPFAPMIHIIDKYSLLTRLSVGLLKASMNLKFRSSRCLKPSPDRSSKIVITEPCPPGSQTLMCSLGRMVWILIT